ncbi:MAG: hypothetical protein OXT69_07250 [Candidatus Poribacteria bacterium]|nr:hypothetical protein [Candidatus Poribacteria bacterium]
MDLGAHGFGVLGVLCGRRFLFFGVPVLVVLAVRVVLDLCGRRFLFFGVPVLVVLAVRVVLDLAGCFLVAFLFVVFLFSTFPPLILFLRRSDAHAIMRLGGFVCFQPS